MLPPKGEPAARIEMLVPPSTNNLFRGRRFKTDTYKSWITAAGQLVNLQRKSPVSGRLAVRIEAPLPKSRDLDNLKAALDLLVTLHLIEDDNRIDWLLIERSQGDLMTVSIWRIGDER